MVVEEFSHQVKETTLTFLDELRNKDSKYSFQPMIKGATEIGSSLKLGFSIYALKIFFMSADWENLSTKDKEEWVDFINGFQSNVAGFPDNSFIDSAYLDYFKKINLKLKLKDLTKKTLNKGFNRQYELSTNFIKKSIRAETKQCIATLDQVGFKNKKMYSDFPKSDIQDFLSSFDWAKPWDAGAQFAGISVFSKTQTPSNDEYEQIKSELVKFISTKVNTDDGAYYIGSQPSMTQAINGAMKVITGLDWLDEKIHFPEKLIDLCLSTNPKNEGCDLVDIVYVLYRCSLETEYKRNEIINYFNEIIPIVKSHYFQGSGGFSYYLERSQQNYYGVQISKGLNTPDIHGTILLTWAIAMMHELINPEENLWKIIKP